MLSTLRNPLAPILLDAYRAAYSSSGRPKPGEEETFRTKLLWDYLAPVDQRPDLLRLCRGLGSLLLPQAPVQAGGVQLPQPFMLAGGWIKGGGYASENEALDHVDRPASFLPGWRTLPLLAGPVEFGSFNRWPRLAPGASGNPGVRAATAYLSLHRSDLPSTYGLNISPPPVPGDGEEMRQEITESLEIIFAADLNPSWITLNLAHLMMDPELDATVDDLVAAASRTMPADTPLWFKVSPGLPATRYWELLKLCDECNVRAIIATDVLFQYHPDGSPNFLSGKALAPLARKAQVALATLKHIHGHKVDIVACGGIMAGRDLPALARLGIQAWQYHSALLHRGPLAAPQIWWEAKKRR